MAMDFNTDVLTISQSDGSVPFSLPDGDWSFCGCFYLDAEITTGYPRIFQMGTPGSAGFITIFVAGSGEAVGNADHISVRAISDNNTDSGVVAATGIAVSNLVGQWVWWKVMYDSTSDYLYISILDRPEVGTGSFVTSRGSVTGFNSLTIGAGGATIGEGSSFYWPGQMAMFSVHHNLIDINTDLISDTRNDLWHGLLHGGTPKAIGDCQLYLPLMEDTIDYGPNRITITDSTLAKVAGFPSYNLAAIRGHSYWPQGQMISTSAVTPSSSAARKSTTRIGVFI